MRWYINEASLQGQFPSTESFETLLRELLDTRKRHRSLATNLRTTRALSDQTVTFGSTLRNVMQASRNRDLKIEVLSWLDRTGPFIDEDRMDEADDYFECLGIDVTDGGLGEAARRLKAGENAATFSFRGGPVDFSGSPLIVDHGLAEERLGSFNVANVCEVRDLALAAIDALPESNSWKELVLIGRQRFPHLVLPDSIFMNPDLAREAFDPVIRDRVLILLGHLNAYMASRQSDGAEGPRAREIIENFFVGDRAPFSGESATNERKFENQLTFVDPDDTNEKIFAPWHGKISRRFFRMHFEWPVPPNAKKLKVLYIGPKITKE